MTTLKKIFCKILICLALLIVMGHSIVVHHHHDDVDTAIAKEHDDHDSDHHHGIFSFGHLDDDFLLSNVQRSLAADMSVFIMYEFTGYSHDFLITNDSPEYHFKNEFPPPDNHSYHFSLRGPPTV
mgnify:CR=1 FL=1